MGPIHDLVDTLHHVFDIFVRPAADDADAAYGIAAQRGHHGEYLVACGVTLCIINLLEMIELNLDQE